MVTRWQVGLGRAAAIGAAAGVGWGVAARVWMRFISTNPEFTWSGTAYIVLAPTIVGLLVGAAIGAEDRTRALRALLRGAAGGSVILLGVGAGMIMVPSIVFGGLAARRTPLGRWTRLLPIPVLYLVAGMVGFRGGTPAALLVATVAAALLVLDRGTRIILAIAAILPVTVVVGSLFEDLPTWQAAAGSVLYLVLLTAVVAPYARAIGASRRTPDLAAVAVGSPASG